MRGLDLAFFRGTSTRRRWASVRGSPALRGCDSQPVIGGQSTLVRRVVAPQKCRDTEVFAGLEIVAGERFVEASLGEVAAIRFAPPGHHAGHAARASPWGAFGYHTGTDVVDDQTAAPRTDVGEVGKRCVDGAAGQIRSDPEPDDQARPGGGEPPAEKALAQPVP